MARARNIKPGFFKNEQLVELPFEARLLFIGLWTLADREGRLEDRPKQIKMEVFPADNVNIDKALNELASQALIVRYEVDGKRYITIPTFLRHQNPHHREPESIIPKPEALPQLQPPQSLGLDGVSRQPKPEAGTPCDNHEAPGRPRESPSLAVLIPDSGFLIPDSPSLNPESGGKAERPRSPHGSRLSLTELPEPWRDYCATQRPELDPGKVFENFRDYWTAKPGKDGRKADWNATWRTWVRREQGQQRKGQGGQGDDLYQRNLRAVGLA